jgi:hypothetical protein
MGFLSTIGSIASAVTGNPTWGAIGGAIDPDDEVRSSPSALESMPPEYRALMTRTANQIMTDLDSLTKGDANKVKEYQQYFQNYSTEITPNDIKNFGSRPNMPSATAYVLGTYNNYQNQGNKQYLAAIEDIESLSDAYQVESAAGKIPVAYGDQGIEPWLKSKLGDKWTDAHTQVLKNLSDTAQRAYQKQPGANILEGSEKAYTYYPGMLRDGLNTVSQQNRWDEADQMLKDSVGVGLGQIPNLMKEYIGNTQKMLRYNTGLGDDEIEKMSVTQLDDYITKIQKGEIKAQPNIERIKADNKQVIDQNIQDALTKAGKTGATVPNMEQLKQLNVINLDAGEQPTDQQIANDFWAIYQGQPIKWSKNASAWITAAGSPGLKNDPKYQQILSAAGDPAVAKIINDATNATLTDITNKVANPNSVNEFIKTSTDKVKAIQDRYDKYLVTMKEQAGGMPEFMKPTDIYSYPGDLTTKASTDELQIQADIREELSTSKTYNDYSKMVEDTKFKVLNEEAQNLAALAKTLGKTDDEISKASVDQLYIWAKSANTPEAQQWITKFDQNVDAAIQPVLREMPADIRSGYLAIQEIEKAMKTSATGLTELISDFKQGRNPTANEEKYRTILTDMAENGLGVDLSSDIYNFATADLKQEATKMKAEREAKMAASGLGYSSASADQQRLIDEELQRNLTKAGLESKIKATELNQKAKEYGITEGTSLEDTLAQRYLKGTQLATDATTGMADEMIERSKGKAAIESGLQQVGEIRRDKSRAELLGLADKQEERQRQNTKNIYDEFIRRINAREGKLAQGINAVAGTGTSVMDAENANKKLEYGAQLEADKGKQQLIGDVFSTIYKPKAKTTKTKAVEDEYGDWWSGFMGEE